jgi:hypothetical protein
VFEAQSKAAIATSQKKARVANPFARLKSKTFWRGIWRIAQSSPQCLNRNMKMCVIHNLGYPNTQSCPKCVPGAKYQGLVDRLTDESALCRNEGAEDIAKLLETAADAIYQLTGKISISNLKDCDGCFGTGKIVFQTDGGEGWNVCKKCRGIGSVFK